MKILLNRTDAIGDLLLTLPVVKYLKSIFPDCEIAVMASPRAYELLKLVPLIDHSFLYRPKDSFFKKLKRCRDLFKFFHPDYYLYYGGDHLPSFWSWFHGVPLRGGLKSRLASFLFLNTGVRQKRREAEFSETLYNIKLLSPLLKKLDSSTKSIPSFSLPEFSVSFELDSQITSTLFEQIKKKYHHSANSEFIVVHPGMTGHSLNWSPDQYGSLIEKIVSDKALEKFSLFISYTPSDEDYIRPLKNTFEKWPTDLKQRVHFLDGSLLGLQGFCHFLSRASLFIGGSTGTTHMANCLNIPQIAIYGPIRVQSAKRWGPLHRHSKVFLFEPKVDCQAKLNCLGESCSDYFCMDRIDVNQVLNQAKEVLKP